MEKSPPISDDEVILRRLTDRSHQTIGRPQIGLTATSFALRPRRGEKFPSWSREIITTPMRLLEIEKNKDRDMVGWSVAAVTVREVRELGLDVVSQETDEDLGHCLIVPTENQRFTDKIWSKLAKKTRVVYTYGEEADL